MPTLDRAVFFGAIRRSPLFHGKLSQSQVDGISAVLDGAPADMALEPLAYCLATDYHETAFTMQPIEEYGKGHGHPYGRPDPRMGGKAPYGRGLVQLTWLPNYQKAKAELGADFVTHPELALVMKWAVAIMFRGMIEGWFTGRKLSDYFGSGKADPKGARRIINGTDKADVIAGYYAEILKALKLAVRASPPAVALPKPPMPAPIAKAA